MIEREKQKDDQQKKHAQEKERHEHSRKDETGHAGQNPAGPDTDPETMKDKGYVKRIEEKTKKH